ncbi:MAG: peptidylprolyl isomerase [Myxococcales bacterium]|nr:peptidylprolyl isomerase [Myxococcales bacterium]
MKSKIALLSVVLAAGCKPAAPAEPTYQPAPAAAAATTPPAPPPAPTPPPAPAAPAAPSGDVAVRPVYPNPSSPDPLGGRFSLAQATAGLPPGRELVAEIETNQGTFSCTMLADRAPNTVANFVGLARGLRDFWDPVSGQWVRRPYYDGSVFHRVIPEFMIQGGDILRSGMGGPGYEFADENVNGHDAAGQLCMANHGPNTNGGQFFITETPRQHLDGSYSIFGRCTPAELVNRIARVPRNERDRPDSPVYIQHVRISRR